MKDFNKFTDDEIVQRFIFNTVLYFVARLATFVVFIIAELFYCISTYDVGTALLILVLYTIMLYSFRNLYRKYLIKIEMILLQHMDPMKYVDIWTSIKNKKFYILLHLPVDLYIARGLYYGGSTQKAIEQLDEAIKHTKRGSRMVLYYNIRFICEAGLGNYNNAEEMIAKIEIIKNKSIKKPVKKFADSVLDIINMEVLYYKGEYAAYEQKIFELLKEINTPMNNSLYNYRLAKLYFETGDFEKSKYRCQYVIENGNKLFVVQKAKEMMEKMG